jgi:hypothetical protein
MPVYKFRIALEQDDTIFRDIEIAPNASFLQFHQTIIMAFGFDGKHQSSFYKSNDNWHKGLEVCLNQKDGVKLMEKVLLVSFIDDPHQKIYYQYDPENDWCFYVELIGIINEQEKVKYPRISRSEGLAPKQYGNMPVSSKDGDIFEEKLAYDSSEDMDDVGLEGTENESGDDDEQDDANDESNEDASLGDEDF